LQLIDGENVSQLIRATGTDSGGFMGMSPTRRKITFRCAFFYTLRDGHIAREQRVYDFTGLLIQVGLLKAKPV
jgi:predicted ester cyclase